MIDVLLILFIFAGFAIAIIVLSSVCYFIDGVELRNRGKRVQEEVKRFTEALDERFRTGK